MVEGARDARQEGEIRDVVVMLHTSLRWQHQLVESGIDHMRLVGNERPKPKLRPTNVKRLLQDCLTIGNGYFYGGGLDVPLGATIARHIKPVVNLEATWVQRFILNLVSNAR